MSWSRFITGSITTPNKSSRGGKVPCEWIIHHNGSLGGRGVLEMMRTGSKQVSANYQVLQGGEAFGVVPREERSWSASNATWDGYALTFEIANNTGAPTWTISDGAYDTVAKIIADDSIFYGIPINRTTVRGHREGSDLGHGGSYDTACPGGIDLDYLVQLAQKYKAIMLAGGSVAGGNSTPIEEDDMFNDNDRAAANLVLDAAGRMEIGVYAANKKLDALMAKIDLVLWATTDDKAGLRTLVVGVQRSLDALAAGKPLAPLDLGELKAALAAAPTVDAAELASLTADEIDKRALERLTTDKESVYTADDRGLVTPPTS